MCIQRQLGRYCWLRRRCIGRTLSTLETHVRRYCFSNIQWIGCNAAAAAAMELSTMWCCWVDLYAHTADIVHFVSCVKTGGGSREIKIFFLLLSMYAIIIWRYCELRSVSRCTTRCYQCSAVLQLSHATIRHFTKLTHSPSVSPMHQIRTEPRILS